MGIPLPQGRPFTALDSVEAPWVVIVNGAMAEPYWPNEAPIGTQLTAVREAFGGLGLRGTAASKWTSCQAVWPDGRNWGRAKIGYIQ